jgi:hypothetical protein
MKKFGYTMRQLSHRLMSLPQGSLVAAARCVKKGSHVAIRASLDPLSVADLPGVLVPKQMEMVGGLTAICIQKNHVRAKQTIADGTDEGAVSNLGNQGCEAAS